MTTGAETAKRASANPKKPVSERDGPLRTPAEAADYFGCTERQIRRLVHEGALTPTYVGKLLRIHISDLDGYLAANRRPAER